MPAGMRIKAHTDYERFLLLLGLIHHELNTLSGIKRDHVITITPYLIVVFCV